MTTLTQAGSSELKQLRVRVRLLKEMAVSINAGLNVKQMVERTLLEAHKSLPEFRISYCTLDAEGTLAVVCSVTPLNMPVIDGRQFGVTRTEALAAVLRSGVHVAVNDVESDERMAALQDLTASVHARAVLIMPVQHPEQTLAFLIFARPTPHAWTSYEIGMLADMAEYLAIAIREAGMQEEREAMNRQLRESQKMEAVGRLVGGVAHDFNNLLTGIMIYSGLLSTALGGSSPLQRHVREIQSAGERGASLVAQLLCLSRSQVLEPHVLWLNDVVGGMQEMLQRVVGEEVVIECQLAADLLPSLLDENLLRQTILNLAINARDAMPTGGKLGFTTRSLTADAGMVERVPGLIPGDYAELSVSDTGEGMSAETLAHCFEPFYTTKALGEGTGLGLASVYGMVQQHGGYIVVQSLLGEGTTFYLYFPVAPASAAELAGENENGGRRVTILLVEDEELLRLPLMEQLKAEGYHVLSAPEGAAALAAAANFGGVIDLLVTDLVMPGMSGAELAERLAGERPEMRVLFISGYTNDVRARELIAAGADFLRKPFNAETFARRVRERVEQTGLSWSGQRRKNGQWHPEQQPGEQEKSISSLRKRDIE